jgi:predicted Zn-dependent peptidase
MIEIAGAVDAERGGAALADIRRAIDELRRGEGFLEDFVRARREALEETVINANDSLSLASRLALIARFDLPPTFFDDHVAALAALTPQNVLALARRELDPALQVLVVEGERAAIEAAFAGAKIASDRMVEAVK